MATDEKADLGKTADGREFPTHGGELLSWDIGSSFTPRDQSEGYPRTRAIIRAFAKHRPDDLARERSSLINGSFDRMFGHNATKLLSLVDEERHQGDTPASRARSLAPEPRDEASPAAFGPTLQSWLKVAERRMLAISTAYSDSRLVPDPGRKYVRIWRQTPGDERRGDRGSAWLFVEIGTGDVFQVKDRNTPKPRAVENIYLSADAGAEIPSVPAPDKARCSICGKVGSKTNLAKHRATCRSSAVKESAASKCREESCSRGVGHGGEHDPAPSLKSGDVERPAKSRFVHVWTEAAEMWTTLPVARLMGSVTKAQAEALIADIRKGRSKLFPGVPKTAKMRILPESTKLDMYTGEEV